MVLFSTVLAVIFAVSPAVAQKADALGQAEVEAYKQEARQLISFLQYTLNAIGGNDLSPKEKDVIINESYKKAFRSEDVQIEDDLVAVRDVVTNKDVQAYLKDVDFFFKDVRFELVVDEVTEGINEQGDLYFLIELNRHMKGITVEGDTIENSKPRFVEVNVDDDNKDLRIVSIYTTKLSRDAELMAWWGTLPKPWKLYLGAEYEIVDGLHLSDVERFTDEGFIVNGIEYQDSINALPLLKKVAARDRVDISGSSEISSLQPLDELNNLRELDISNTDIEDLTPIRNLNKLQVLRTAHTKVEDLSPLRYARLLTELYIDYTPVTNLSVLQYLENLEKLSTAHTVIDRLPVYEGLANLRVLNMESTNLDDVDSVETLAKLEQLNISNTAVANLAPLASLQHLKHLEMNRTSISDISPLAAVHSLEYISFSNTTIESLAPLVALPNLKKVICDGTDISRESIAGFYRERPDVEVIFSTAQLEEYWKGLDDAWKKYFRARLNITGEPSRDKLHGIIRISDVHLSAQNGIRSIDALSVMIALKKLDISHTAVSDLSPLANLSSLEVIDFSETKVADLSPLAGHTQLRVVRGSRSSVADMSPLSGCKNIDSLFFNHTAIADLTPLNALPDFKAAYFENSKVTEEDLIGLTFHADSAVVIFQTDKLQNWWGMMDDEWQNILRAQFQLGSRPSTEELHRLISRQELQVKSVVLDNLDPVPTFVRLREFSITDSRVKSLEKLSALQQLEILRCPRNPIESIEPLSAIKSLKIVDLDNTPVDELDALEGIPGLQELKINGTAVKRLDPLENQKQLQVLECSNTRVRNIQPIMDLHDLRIFKCFNTRINERKIEDFKRAHPECEVVYY